MKRGRVNSNLQFSNLSTFEAVCRALYWQLSWQIVTISRSWQILLTGIVRDSHFVLNESIESSYMEKLGDKVQIRKQSAHMETSPDNDQKRCVFKQTFATPKSSFTFHSRKKFISFSNQCIITRTKSHGLQHSCFHGQANFYRLCKPWKLSRQI